MRWWETLHASILHPTLGWDLLKATVRRLYWAWRQRKDPISRFMSFSDKDWQRQRMLRNVKTRDGMLVEQANHEALLQVVTEKARAAGYKGEIVRP